jgi:hypothetical protein
VEIEVSAALLRETAHELGQLIQQMGGQPPALIPGYQVRILDGNALASVKPGQLWIADRNMCTLEFLTGIAQRQSAFVIRLHQNLPWQALSDLQWVAEVEVGQLWEQRINIEYQGQPLQL